MRLRIGKGRRETFRLPDLEEDVAQARATQLERARDMLVRAGKHEQVSKLLANAAAQRDEGEFIEAILNAEDVAGGKLGAVPLTPRTFRDVCDLWCSGELHKRYPHRVASKKPETQAKDKARLDRICETIGSIPIGRVTEADSDRAIAALPPLAESTRTKYAQLLDYVLRLAVSPLRLTKASPLPEKWVPGSGERAEFQMLFPDEEAQLMRCAHLTLERKYFWGLLARTGMRVDELVRAVRGDLDLERGTWKVTGKNPRGGRPKVRRFGLSLDVLEALRAKLAGALPGDPVVSFGDDPDRAAEFFRLDLSDCGIDRRELHETTATGRRIRAHDLRGTFVALALAQGRSDQWIMDRTGHSQSQMLRVYDRDSRHAADLKLGWFEPLDILLGVGPRVGGDSPKGSKRLCPSESNADSYADADLALQPETAAEREPERAEEVARHPGTGGGRSVRPSGESPTADPVEAALALALRAAVDAGRLDLVPGIVAELGERRRAREASGVPSLEQARAKRRNGESE